MVVRKTIKVNGRALVVYPYNGIDYTDLRVRLHDEYKTQGDFYQKEFGVSYQTALAAGWEPDSRLFDEESDGWSRFLADRGQVEREEIVEKVSWADVLFTSDHD